MHIYIEVIKKDTKEGKRERGKWLHNLDKINIKLHLLKEQKAQEGFLLLIYGRDSVSKCGITVCITKEKITFMSVKHYYRLYMSLNENLN